MDSTLPDRLHSNCVELFTGKMFWPLNPITEDIDIIDIAHALSNKCRYTGHTRQFYSVAQHCILMARETSETYKLESLLHDATEAYLPDIASPIKGHFNGFKDIEERLHVAIAERFNLIHPLPKQVKALDRKILRAEKWYLMHGKGLDMHGSTSRIGIAIVPWGPQEAERRFVDAYCDYVANRNVPDPWHLKGMKRTHRQRARYG